MDEHEVRLVAPDGETWALSTLDSAIQVEEDVFFADPSGIRASRQLELHFEPGESMEIQWVMSRIASAGSH